MNPLFNQNHMPISVIVIKLLGNFQLLTQRTVACTVDCGIMSASESLFQLSELAGITGGAAVDAGAFLAVNPAGNSFAFFVIQIDITSVELDARDAAAHLAVISNDWTIIVTPDIASNTKAV